ncbi:MAG: extracellular solute-binding protein [Spirochaetales bacterium]|nr:extracellular solute-binding protein [Spirochaetales bacterium]
MKRILIVVAVLLTGFFLFAEGQGEGGATAAAADKLDMKGRVLKYIAWWNPAPDQELWKLKVAHLEKKYNFKLDNINSGGWQSHHDDLVASITAGAPIGEYVYVDQSFFAGWVSEKLLLPVEDYGIDYSQPYYHQQKREGFTFLGHEYSIKDQFIEPSTGWWFNKSMLEREGLESVYELQSQGKWTWDKMLEMAKACTKDLDGNGTIDQWGFGEDPLHVAALAFIASNGGNIVSDGKYVMNSPQVLEALQFYQDLNLKHKVVAMRPEESEWNWAYYQFGQGKIAFLPFHFWASDSQFGSPEDELGWALFPAGPKGEATSGYYPNNTVVLPAGTKEPQKVLYIWDQIWKPDPQFTDPDADPFSYLYSKFYDLESVEETQYMMSVGGRFVPFTHEIFGFKSAWEGIPGEILKGEKTPQVALEEVSPVFQAKLKELLGQ